MQTMRTLSLLVSLLLLVLGGTGFAAEDALEIVKQANRASYYAGQDGRADVHMVITDASGGTRERSFNILRLNVAGEDQKFYVYFREPADVSKMAYLVWKHVGGDDDRWLWLPALNLKKRIAPGDKRTSFVGSDFFYEDVSGRGVNEDDHALVETGATFYLIKSVPKDPGSVEFSSYQVWIDAKSYLPLKAEYLDKNGELYRRVEATRIETIQGHPTVMEAVASDLKAGTKTSNSFSNVAYDIGLKEQIFTERFLRRPPREVSGR
jgi:Outer membrane lipoprotein-sorting protein